MISTKNLRSVRLERLHARCLEFSEEFPRFHCLALRTDDEECWRYLTEYPSDHLDFVPTFMHRWIEEMEYCSHRQQREFERDKIISEISNALGDPDRLWSRQDACSRFIWDTVIGQLRYGTDTARTEPVVFKFPDGVWCLSFIDVHCFYSDDRFLKPLLRLDEVAGELCEEFGIPLPRIDEHRTITKHAAALMPLLIDAISEPEKLGFVLVRRTRVGVFSALARLIESAHSQREFATSEAVEVKPLRIDCDVSPAMNTLMSIADGAKKYGVSPGALRQKLRRSGAKFVRCEDPKPRQPHKLFHEETLRDTADAIKRGVQG